MIRKLLLLVSVAIGCLASPAYGLGLGELELKSALNQRFSAKITLTNVRGLQVEEILPSLASQEDFDRVGIERNYLLTDLRFKVAPNELGDMVIFVTSNKSIIEPFLNFIVEVLWPTGRILREYTVLLDPPVFGQQRVEAVQPSQTSSRPATPAAQPVTQAPKPASRRSVIAQPQTQPVISNQQDRQGDVAGTEYAMTGQGDTLWSIALRVRPSKSVSVQQTILALQRANPEAFINNNINLLKAGYVLRIPDVREIQAETVASAVQQVRTQNQLFDSYKGGSLAQLDATRRKSGSSTASNYRASDELKLLASNNAPGDRSGPGGSVRVNELEYELAVAEEDLDRTRRANSEMNVKVDDLQGQLDTLNEILTLKDDQLAALKSEVQKMQATSNQPAAVQPAPSVSWLSNPLVLGVLGLLVVGAVAGGMTLMRRRQQTDALDTDFEDAFEAPAAEAEDITVVAQLNASPAIEEEEEDLSPETSDVISEVEIYIAYGRFPQAITFLQNAIQAEPNRSDIQVKLLEVYVQTEEAVAFNLQLEQLRLLNDDEATSKALEFQQKILGAAEDAAVAMDATIISMEPVEAIAEPEDDDDDMSFDLDDLNSETEENDLTLDADLELDDDILDLSGVEEDDFDLEKDLETVALNLGKATDDDELIFDFDDDLDIDLESDGLDLDDDDEITLDLEGDDEITLDLESEDEFSLDLDDDDEFSLDLDDDDDNKLDLARAYIDMGDSDGAKSLLKQVLNDGSDLEKQEATELLEKIDLLV
jgi:pilus assembly protein FimV